MISIASDGSRAVRAVVAGAAEEDGCGPPRWYPQGAWGTRPLSFDDRLAWYVA